MDWQDADFPIWLFSPDAVFWIVFKTKLAIDIMI